MSKVKIWIKQEQITNRSLRRLSALQTPRSREAPIRVCIKNAPPPSHALRPFPSLPLQFILAQFPCREKLPLRPASAPCDHSRLSAGHFFWHSARGAEREISVAKEQK